MSSSVLAQRCFPAPPRKSRATHNCETRRRKQAGGQCQGNVARQCCDQDWKQGRGEQGNAETLQKLTQVFDMLSHYTIPTARRGWTFNSRMDAVARAEAPTLRRIRSSPTRYAWWSKANGRSWRTSCYRQTRRGDHVAKPSKRPDSPATHGRATVGHDARTSCG